MENMKAESELQSSVSDNSSASDSASKILPEVSDSSFSTFYLPFSIYFSRLYGKIADVRNSLYEKGVFASHSLGAPTVSVGNITVGGTGKTPLVAYVAEFLASKGEKVGVLSRGYGRENPQARVLVSDGEKVPANASQAGDEPFELANKLLAVKAIVISDANRVAAAKWAREKFAVTAFVLDDAFQHQKAKRDLNIVLLDATNPFGNRQMLPQGILREPLENLARADVIIITRADLIKNTDELKTEIARFNRECSIFTVENKVAQLTELAEFQNPKSRTSNFKSGIQNLKFKTALAFCALGNPNNFFEQLRREDFNLIVTETFPDHHFYTAQDLEKLNQKAADANAEIFLTTAKDAAKLPPQTFRKPCFVVENDLIFDDETAFVKLLEDILP